MNEGGGVESSFKPWAAVRVPSLESCLTEVAWVSVRR